MTNLEVEIEAIVSDEPTYYRTAVYEVFYRKTNEPIRMAKKIFRSPTIQTGVSTLAGIVASE